MRPFLKVKPGISTLPLKVALISAGCFLCYILHWSSVLRWPKSYPVCWSYKYKWPHHLAASLWSKGNKKLMIQYKTCPELNITNILWVILSKIQFDYERLLCPVWPWQQKFQRMNLLCGDYLQTNDEWAQKIILRVTLFRKPLSIFYGPRCEAYMWKSP